MGFDLHYDKKKQDCMWRAWVGYLGNPKGEAVSGRLLMSRQRPFVCHSTKVCIKQDGGLTTISRADRTMLRVASTRAS
jgi:hypothetical protein